MLIFNFECMSCKSVFSTPKTEKIIEMQEIKCPICGEILHSSFLNSLKEIAKGFKSYEAQAITYKKNNPPTNNKILPTIEYHKMTE